MINLLTRWWRSHQFKTAIRQGNDLKAKKILKSIEKSGKILSCCEQLFKEKIQLEESLQEQKRQTAKLRKKVIKTEPLLTVIEKSSYGSSMLPLDRDFIDFIEREFKIQYLDENLIQCTGIHAREFYHLEDELAIFLESEIEKVPSKIRNTALQEALNDIEGLKQGIDPNYDLRFTPHIYLMRYFLENIYCSYLSWFLLYKNNLIPSNLNILDVAAGPGTVTYGLALLLQSCRDFVALPPLHISYSSVEKQSALQYRGLQFWRRYIETQPTPINAYFQFNTLDLFEYDRRAHQIPKKFFDFIVISHCFFADRERRVRSHRTYRHIFSKCLKPTGYVLLVIQGYKLHSFYNRYPHEKGFHEKNLIETFLGEMGLQLEWYKYLSSTGKRIYNRKEFGKFARETLSPYKSMSALHRKYIQSNFDFHYAIDDYVILAKR